LLGAGWLGLDAVVFLEGLVGGAVSCSGVISDDGGMVGDEYRVVSYISNCEHAICYYMKRCRACSPGIKPRLLDIKPCYPRRPVEPSYMIGRGEPSGGESSELACALRRHFPKLGGIHVLRLEAFIPAADSFQLPPSRNSRPLKTTRKITHDVNTAP